MSSDDEIPYGCGRLPHGSMKELKKEIDSCARKRKLIGTRKAFEGRRVKPRSKK